MCLKLADFGLAIDLREERAVTRAGTLGERAGGSAGRGACCASAWSEPAWARVLALKRLAKPRPGFTCPPPLRAPLPAPLPAPATPAADYMAPEVREGLAFRLSGF